MSLNKQNGLVKKQLHPFLSVVIPAKNEGKYIDKCLDSLRVAINSWGGKAETILVDNGSVDSTKGVAKDRGCIVIDVPNGTIAKLRNCGAKTARGVMITFLDADCLVAPSWISYCLEDFADHKIAAVGTRVVPEFDRSTWVQRAWFRIAPGAKKSGFVDWLGTSNLFVRKDVFFGVGGFDETLESGEDVNLCFKIRKIKKFVYLDKRINTVHLRESRTLPELLKREYCRGKSSLRSLFKSQATLKEFPSVAVPAINLAAIILLIILIALKSTFVIIPGIIIVLFPTALLVVRRIKPETFTGFFQCLVVATAYISSRSISLSYEIYVLLKMEKLMKRLLSLIKDTGLS